MVTAQEITTGDLSEFIGRRNAGQISAAALLLSCAFLATIEHDTKTIAENIDKTVKPGSCHNC